MRWVWLISLLTAACSQAADLSRDEPAPISSQKPQRIVSLDLCADQYVLKFADRNQIMALSPEARLEISYMRDLAQGIPTVKPLAENILILKPDLVVRAYGGGPNATAFFEKAGIPVLNIGWASDIEGIKRVVQDMADGMSVPEEGKALVADMQSRLDALQTPETPKKTALYMTVSGVTTGPDTLIHDMFKKAGLQNYVTKAGWHSLPIEDLAQNKPDVISLAYHESINTHRDTWSAARNPIARKLLNEIPVVPLDGAVMSCSGWYVIDAVEALAKGAK